MIASSYTASLLRLLVVVHVRKAAFSVRGGRFASLAFELALPVPRFCTSMEDQKLPENLANLNIEFRFFFSCLGGGIHFFWVRIFSFCLWWVVCKLPLFRGKWVYSNSLFGESLNEWEDEERRLKRPDSHIKWKELISSSLASLRLSPISTRTTFGGHFFPSLRRLMIEKKLKVNRRPKGDFSPLGLTSLTKGVSNFLILV